jgi:hypothetical protein
MGARFMDAPGTLEGAANALPKESAVKTTVNKIIPRICVLRTVFIKTS